MIMNKDVFQFKLFAIRQDRCAMKVGTDGVLIGAWAKGGNNILDIGTGTGIVAMMMAQRFPLSEICALDIDADACLQAAENIEAAHFSDRITICNTALQQHNGLYDAIVSNPPYFENSLKAPDDKRSMARHTDTLPVKELFAGVSRMLSADGTFSVIIPFEMLGRYEEEAAMSGLFLSQLCNIRTVARKPVRRCMAQFCKSRPETLNVEEHVLMQPDGTRSQWYQQLTADFYL